MASVTTPSCGASLDPVTKPPASCAITMPAYSASAYKKNIIRLRTTTHADIPWPYESSKIILFSALSMPGTKYKKIRTSIRSPYSVQEKARRGSPPKMKRTKTATITCKRAPVHIQRTLRDERKIQRRATDRAQRVRHNAVRRCARKARKAIRFALYRLASAVRAPLDRYECAR